MVFFFFHLTNNNNKNNNNGSNGAHLKIFHGIPEEAQTIWSTKPLAEKDLKQRRGDTDNK